MLKQLREQVEKLARELAELVSKAKSVVKRTEQEILDGIAERKQRKATERFEAGLKELTKQLPPLRAGPGVPRGAVVKVQGEGQIVGTYLGETEIDKKNYAVFQVKQTYVVVAHGPKPRAFKKGEEYTLSLEREPSLAIGLGHYVAAALLRDQTRSR